MSYSTFCFCWEITREDSQVFRYTTHSSNLDFLGNTFSALPSLNNTVIQKSLGLGVDNLEFTGVFGPALGITLDDVRDGKYEGAEVIGYKVNHQDVSEYKVEVRGVLSEFMWNDVGFTTEIRSKTYLLNKSRGQLYNRTCPYRLGETSCGVDLTSFDQTLTVQSTSGLDVVVTGTTESVYSLGFIEWPSGKTQMIRTQDGQTLSLWETPSGGEGDSIRVMQGCDKTRQTCKSKFSNIVNFGGFDLIPPEDILSDIGAPGKGIFNGGSYFERLT